MITKVIIPKSGMGIEEGTLARWLKAVGESVSEGEVIAEIETAKAIHEITAPVSGKLIRILLGQGETAPVTTEIALIEHENE